MKLKRCEQGERAAEGAHNFTLFLLCYISNSIGVGRSIGNIYVMAASGRIQDDYKQTAAGSV
jgi:hypothetical protein